LLAALALIWPCACVTETRSSGKGSQDERRPSAAVSRSAARAVPPCVIGGCSGQICAAEPLFSSCEWRPEYACFGQAICEPQRDTGRCGWTMTDALRACLEAVSERR
jgi:hypothetical protein